MSKISNVTPLILKFSMWLKSMMFILKPPD